MHDDVIRWKHFPRYRPFVRGIHRTQVNSLHKGQWRGALLFSLICAWTNGWIKKFIIHSVEYIRKLQIYNNDAFLHLKRQLQCFYQPTSLRQLGEFALFKRKRIVIQQFVITDRFNKRLYTHPSSKYGTIANNDQYRPTIREKIISSPDLQMVTTFAIFNSSGRLPVMGER